jgi:hypothetical protein
MENISVIWKKLKIPNGTGSDFFPEQKWEGSARVQQQALTCLPDNHAL